MTMSKNPKKKFSQVEDMRENGQLDKLDIKELADTTVEGMKKQMHDEIGITTPMKVVGISIYVAVKHPLNDSYGIVNGEAFTNALLSDDGEDEEESEMELTDEDKQVLMDAVKTLIAKKMGVEPSAMDEDGEGVTEKYEPKKAEKKNPYDGGIYG